MECPTNIFSISGATFEVDKLAFDDIFPSVKQENDQDKDRWYFPADVHLALLPIVVGIIAVCFISGLSWAKSMGDTTLFDLGILLALIGIGLLFFAKLQLYRQGRFFTIGPSHLTGVNRRIYALSYLIIGLSILLLGTLLSTMH